MSFHEIQFPSDISYGAKGGPRRLTQVVTLQSGFEQRNQVWANSRRKYDVGHGLKNLNDIGEVIDFWEARSGPLYGFRYKDWADYKSCPVKNTISATDQIIDTGDDTAVTFQLVKRYMSGSNEYARPIKKPVSSTVVVALDDVQILTGFSVDYTTGIITFDDPVADGVVITAGFEFDVPARFETDDIDVSIEGYQAGAIQSISIIEIRV